MKSAVDEYSHALDSFIRANHLAIPRAFLLYSRPFFFVDGLRRAFHDPSSLSPAGSTVPSNWIELGPLRLPGVSSPDWLHRKPLAGLQNPRFTSRIVVFMGANNGFEVWQVKTIIGGLQDPSTQVIIAGTASIRRKHGNDNIVFVDTSKVSVFSLFEAVSITAVISYCDLAVVEAALYRSIPLLCVPSLRNHEIVQFLVERRVGIAMPDGFWAESTVRDLVRQLVSLEPREIARDGFDAGMKRVSGMEWSETGEGAESFWIEEQIMRVLRYEF